MHAILHVEHRHEWRRTGIGDGNLEDVAAHHPSHVLLLRLDDRRQLTGVADDHRLAFSQTGGVEKRRQNGHGRFFDDDRVKSLRLHQRREVGVGQRRQHEGGVGNHLPLFVEEGLLSLSDALVAPLLKTAQSRRPLLHEPEPFPNWKRVHVNRAAFAKDIYEVTERVWRADAVKQTLLNGFRSSGENLQCLLALPEARFYDKTPARQTIDRLVVPLVQTDDHLTHRSAERGRVTPADAHRASGADILGHLGIGRYVGQRLVQRGIGRGENQHAQTLRAQFRHDMPQRRRLTGPRRAPHERQVAVGAQLDCGKLTRIQPVVRTHQFARRRGRVALAEQGHRAFHREVVRVDLVEHLEQLFVEEPGIDDQHALTIPDIDRAFARQRHVGAVHALHSDEILRDDGAQGAVDARYELLVRRYHAVGVTCTAFRPV
jgi:hypothetical protein